jgi:thioredoxin-related protein
MPVNFCHLTGNFACRGKIRRRNSMKSAQLFTFLLLHLVAGSYAFSQKALPAGVLMKAALDEAATTHKNVFIIFHASWCVWCHKMDSSMNDESLKSFFHDNYVVVHLTVDEINGKQQFENP